MSLPPPDQLSPAAQARFQQDIERCIARGTADDYATVDALLAAHAEVLPPDAVAQLRTVSAGRWQMVYLFEGMYAHSGLVHLGWWRTPEGSVVCRVVVAPVMPPALQAAQAFALPETLPRQVATAAGRRLRALMFVLGLAAALTSLLLGMRGEAWWYRAGLLLFTVLPIASTLLGLGAVNMLAVGALCILWLAWPSVGSVLYTATWISLLGYRIVHTTLARDRLRIAFPMTVNNQNGASAWLMILGILGGIRSGFAGDGLGIALGVIGAAVLFFSQGPLFQPAQ